MELNVLLPRANSPVTRHELTPHCPPALPAHQQPMELDMRAGDVIFVPVVE